VVVAGVQDQELQFMDKLAVMGVILVVAVEGEVPHGTPLALLALAVTVAMDVYGCLPGNMIFGDRRYTTVIGNRDLNSILSRSSALHPDGYQELLTDILLAYGSHESVQDIVKAAMRTGVLKWHGAHGRVIIKKTKSMNLKRFFKKEARYVGKQ
jgi:hypothetical protein